MKVVLVDRQQILREGVRSLLAAQTTHEVVGEASTGSDAVQIASELSPDLLLIEADLAVVDSVTVTRRLMHDHPEVRVLVLASKADPTIVSALLEAGVTGFVLKDNGFDELKRAMTAVGEGKSYLSPDVANVVVERHVRENSSMRGPVYSKLSAREREVLRLVAEGCTTKETAARLSLSPKTVDSHRQRIMKKLRAANVADLVKHAIRGGLISLSDDD